MANTLNFGLRLHETGKIPTFAHLKTPDLQVGEFKKAEVAQLVERNLAKVKVAGSRPVFRSQKALSR